MYVDLLKERLDYKKSVYESKVGTLKTSIRLDIDDESFEKNAIVLLTDMLELKHEMLLLERVISELEMGV